MKHATIEDWSPWFDGHGFVTNNTSKRGTGNGLMYTATYAYWLSVAKPFHYKQEYERIRTLYEKCWVPNGGFNRAPDGWYSTHLNQNDDYFGVALTSRVIEADFAARCLKVMRDNWGLMNNLEPGKFRFKSFIGRMPQVTVTLQFAANERPSLWGLAFWLLWLFTSLTRGKRDSVIKGWMASRTAAGRNKLLDGVLKVYWYFFKKTYTGVGKKEYFPKDHPFKKYMWDWT